MSWIARLGSLAVVAAGIACGGDSTPPATLSRVEISATSATVVEGATLQLSALARLSDGSAQSGAAFAWTSDDTTIASVSATGLVTGRRAGSTTIHASTGTASGAQSLTVTPAPVASVTLEPDTATLTTGDTRTFAARVFGPSGNTLSGRAVVFSSSDTSVATVRADGVVTALSPGIAVLSADVEGKHATAAVTVVRGALPKLTLKTIATGVSGRFVAAPPGDSRLFLATVEGRIWIIQNDVIQPQPFLDIRDRVNQGINGLYSFAFHPRFATNGLFYVDYVDASGNDRIERYQVPLNSSIADPASAQLLLTVVHPPPLDHYGGWLAFGPDGKLYISTGDGGPGDSENAQNKSLLLGKLLRLDVDAAPPYVPADNPFVNVAGARPEIWAYGLRNPFRDSFDRLTGTLYVADVGEDDWEEVNAVPFTRAGADYGWNKLEGSHCSTVSTTGCSDPGAVLPVLEYSHPGRPGAVGAAHPTGCSVTGGYVYRGNKMPSLRGHYFYADFCAGWIRSFRLSNGAVVDAQQWFDNVGSVMSFGEDGAGELYVLTFEGNLYRITPAP
jgi:glucose/arabinose dehydrogenase